MDRTQHLAQGKSEQLSLLGEKGWAAKRFYLAANSSSCVRPILLELEVSES